MAKQHRIRPVVFVWDGQHMIPLPRFKRLCDVQFAVNEEYPLMLVENRSLASHNHYFASIAEGFENLAEEYAQEFYDSEHLRAWCLCREGFCTQTRWVMNTAEDARQLRDALKKDNKSAIIRVEGNVATVYTPESQKMTGPGAMKKERFEASKSAVLSRIAAMARTTVTELKKNAGRSA